MMFGLILAGVTLYLALEIALSFTVGGGIAFGLAAIPFLLCLHIFQAEEIMIYFFLVNSRVL